MTVKPRRPFGFGAGCFSALPLEKNSSVTLRGSVVSVLQLRQTAIRGFPFPSVFSARVVNLQNPSVDFITTLNRQLGLLHFTSSICDFLFIC